MCKNNTRRRLILVFWFCIYHLPDRAHSRKCSQKGFIAGQFLKVHFCASNCCAVQALLKQLCERDSITFSSIQKCGKWRSNRSLITLSAFLWGVSCHLFIQLLQYKPTPILEMWWGCALHKLAKPNIIARKTMQIVITERVNKNLYGQQRMEHGKSQFTCHREISTTKGPARGKKGFCAVVGTQL